MPIDKTLECGELPKKSLESAMGERGLALGFGGTTGVVDWTLEHALHSNDPRPRDLTFNALFTAGD